MNILFYVMIDSLYLPGDIIVINNNLYSYFRFVNVSIFNRYPIELQFAFKIYCPLVELVFKINSKQLIETHYFAGL